MDITACTDITDNVVITVTSVVRGGRGAGGRARTLTRRFDIGDGSIAVGDVRGRCSKRVRVARTSLASVLDRSNPASIRG